MAEPSLTLRPALALADGVSAVQQSQGWVVGWLLVRSRGADLYRSCSFIRSFVPLALCWLLACWAGRCRCTSRLSHAAAAPLLSSPLPSSPLLALKAPLLPPSPPRFLSSSPHLSLLSLPSPLSLLPPLPTVLPLCPVRPWHPHNAGASSPQPRRKSPISLSIELSLQRCVLLFHRPSATPNPPTRSRSALPSMCDSPAC